MVNDVPAGAARRAPFQRGQLSLKLRHVEQPAAHAVQDRQQLAIEVGLALLARLIGDPVRRETIPDPGCPVPVARDPMDAVGLAERGKLSVTASGEPRTSRTASSTTRSPSTCAIAMAWLSAPPPDTSTKAA